MSFYQSKFPAIKCMIKHILEGQFSEEDVLLFTIFGKLKNVNIIGTVIDKREEFYQREGEERQRIIFELDDCSGQIQAVKWDAFFEKYENLKIGDTIEIIGNFPKKWNQYKTISIDFLTKVEDPNLVLLRNAEIIKRIKKGDIQEIPDLSEPINGFDEIYVKDLFEEEQNINKNDVKEAIYKKIEEMSLNGIGISFKDLRKDIRITENELRKYIKDLEIESRIYQSDENIYQSY